MQIACAWASASIAAGMLMSHSWSSIVFVIPWANVGPLASDAAMALARELAAGPTFANGITKTMLHQEWAMTIEQAIEAEAQAQAICMLTEDFTRAYEAFAPKQKPRFEGN